MGIDQVGQMPAQTPALQPDRNAQVIDSNEIKAILYLGIRGKIELPVEQHKVDVLV